MVWVIVQLRWDGQLEMDLKCITDPDHDGSMRMSAFIN